MVTECRPNSAAALSHNPADLAVLVTGCAPSAVLHYPHLLIAPTQRPVSAALRTPLGVQAHSVTVVAHLHQHLLCHVPRTRSGVAHPVNRWKTTTFTNRRRITDMESIATSRLTEVPNR